jgi:hypothetical protein
LLKALQSSSNNAIKLKDTIESAINKEKSPDSA